MACSNTEPAPASKDGDADPTDVRTSDASKYDASFEKDVRVDASGSDTTDLTADLSTNICLPGEKDPTLHSKILEAWTTALPRLESYLVSDSLQRNPYPIYNVQLFSANILMYADYYQDRDFVSALAKLYRIAYLALRENTRYVFYYAKGADGVVRRDQVLDIQPALIWTGAPGAFDVGSESILVSSQFLYAVARLVRMIGEMSSPSPKLVSFVDESVPILTSHYRRWLKREEGGPGNFQVKGWGCNSGTFDHQEHVANLKDRRYGTAYFSADVSTSYCNAVTDTDLWIIAGLAELFGASKDSVDGLGIQESDTPLFESHIKAGIELIRSRHIKGELDDKNGGMVEGAVFDRGAFDDHPGHSYSGVIQSGPDCNACVGTCSDVCPEFPGWKDEDDKTPRVAPNPVVGTGWDLSHARRLVSVFDSLRRHRDLFGSDFPTAENEGQYARQLAFGMWNGDEITPKFTTFFDGTNGWYRVNYSNRVAFGYAPYAMSGTAISCGYGFWNAHVPRLKMAMEAAQSRYASSRDPANLGDALALILSLPESAPYTGRDGKCAWTKE